MKKIVSVLLAFLMGVVLSGCAELEQLLVESPPAVNTQQDLDEDGYYYATEDVAFYLHTFDQLPSNYLTKNEAMDLGWVSSEGNLWEVADGLVIGGDRFGNFEGLLPEESGRQYFEADVNYDGGFRGPERLVYSSDGLIYYTPDHYDSFDLLYGEE